MPEASSSNLPVSTVSVPNARDSFGSGKVDHRISHLTEWQRVKSATTKTNDKLRNIAAVKRTLDENSPAVSKFSE